VSARELKSRILKLLREDEEFRYAVAGLLGLEEILKRLDRHEAELVRLREDMNKLREDMVRHEAELVRLREDMNRLREDMIRGFELVERHISAWALDGVSWPRTPSGRA
jgi:predicted  nucleic acid-binding Zn-ribbon protein